MEQVNINNIPQWLHNSDLYKNITDDEDFLIPKNNFKKTHEINNLEDFILYYNTIKFWGMDYSQDFYDYCLNNKQEVLNYLKNYNCKYNLELNEFILELERSSNVRIKYSIDFCTYLKSNNIYKLTIFILEKNNIVFKFVIHFFSKNKIFNLCTGSYKRILIEKNKNIIIELIENIKNNKKYITHYSSEQYLEYEFNSIKINSREKSELSFDAFALESALENKYSYIPIDTPLIEFYNIENPESSFEIKISKFNINNILYDLLIIEKIINNVKENNIANELFYTRSDKQYINLNIFEFNSVNINSNLT